MRKRISLLLLSFFVLVQYAQTSLPDTAILTSSPLFLLDTVSDKPIDLHCYISAFEDSSRALTIDQVSSPGFFTRFHENKFSRKPWQNQSYVIWARLRIKNASGSFQRIYLTGGFGDTIICYNQAESSLFGSRITGRLVPLINRGNTLIPHCNFEYAMERDDTVSFYFRMCQDNYVWLPNVIPITLYTYSSIGSFHNQLKISWVLNGIYCGMVFFMILYALALLVIFRERVYLWLVIFQISNFMYFLDDTGIGFNLLYPDSIWLYKYGSTSFLWAILLFHFIFVASYLGIRKLFPRTYLILLTITLVAAFSRFVFWAFGYFQLGRYLEDYGILIMIILFFSVVFYMAFIRKMRLAKIMILGEISVVIAGIITGLTFTQIINFPSNYAMNILQVGFALQMLLWTVAIVDKIILLRKEKEASQSRALELALKNEQMIRDQNVFLGNKVEERTRKLKETQSQLIQSEKMASLGMLTAGIAHEINNPINFINSGVISLQKDYDDLHQILQSVGTFPQATQKLADELNLDELLKIIPETIVDIKTGVERTSEIVQGLRNFTRLDVSDLKETDIHRGIDSALLLLSHKIHNRIRIVKSYDKNIGYVKCYPGLLNQVFMNLLNNAIDAIDQKIAEDRSGDIKSGSLFQVGIITRLISDGGRKQVIITISDNGSGIHEEIRDKLFDPFFTTKKVGKGNGFGLSICHEIVEKHDGRITFQSKENEGTEFMVALPVV